MWYVIFLNRASKRLLKIRSAKRGTMRKLLLMGLLIVIPDLAAAQFHDNDGHLVVIWQPPAYGTPLDHYEWAYTINGVADSMAGTSVAGDTLDDSANLAAVGDWAIFKIRAISTVDDTSTWAVTDTVTYDTDTGIGPPRGVTWIQGP
jgi:hypothetical protein